MSKRLSFLDLFIDRDQSRDLASPLEDRYASQFFRIDIIDKAKALGVKVLTEKAFTSLLS